MLNLDHSTFPVLRTHRLVLRRPVPEYAISLHQLRSDAEVNRYLDREPSAGVADALAFIKKITALVDSKKSMYWVITLAGDNTLVGTICLWNYDLENATVEMGFELMPSRQGKGLMAEAVAIVIDYCFKQLNARAITAFTTADNARSISLLKRFKFAPEPSLLIDEYDGAGNMTPYLLKRG